MSNTDSQPATAANGSSLLNSWMEITQKCFSKEYVVKQKDFIAELLNNLRQILNCDRAYITEFSREYDRFEQTYETLNEGVESRISEFKSFNSVPFTKMITCLSEGNVVKLSNIDVVGEFHELTRTILGKTLTKAILLIGLFNQQQQLIGALGVSYNTIHAWTDEELELIELASRMISSRLCMKLDKLDLDSSRKFQSLVLEISSQFINLPGEQVNHTIMLSLEKLARFMNMQKACMFLVHKDDPTLWSMTHEWTENVPIRWHQFQNVAIPENDLVVNDLREMKPIEIGDLEHCPERFSVMKDILKISGVKCLIEIPISYKNKFVGFLGLTGTQTRRSWSQTDLALIKFAGEMFYQSLLQQATLEELETNNKKLREQSSFEELLTYVSTRLINAESQEIDSFLDECIGMLCPLLGAKAMMICEFLHGGKDARYIAIHTREESINRPDWVLKRQVKPIHEMKMHWFWQELLQGKRLIFENLADLPEAANLESEAFLKYGDHSIAHFPLTIGNEVIGFYFISFSEKKTWDAELIEKFSVIAQITANAIHRRRTEEKLNYLNQVEQLLSRLSTGFINLPLENIDVRIKQSLAEIGQILNIDRTYLYEYSDDEIWLKLKHYWLSPEIPLDQSPKPIIDTRQTLWAHNQLKQGKFLNFADINKIPDEAYELRDMYQQMGVKSTLFFPIFCHQKLKALWGFSTLRSYRDFTDQDLTVLSIFATTLANAMERFEDESHRDKLLQELESKNRELESFTYTVSHDLKSPIITINGFIGALREDLKTLDQQAITDDLAEIENAASRMKLLLDELLRLSRIGRVTNQSVSVDLNFMVHEVANSFKPLFLEKNIKLTIKPDLPTVHGDPIRLREVIQNLVHNACKFTDKTRPEIEIGMTIGDEQRRLIYIKDNGIGIERKYLERIFGLFERLDAKGEGTGIGLAIVKKIVENHQGLVWGESQGLGQGTTFFLYLPPSPHVEN